MTLRALLDRVFTMPGHTNARESTRAIFEARYENELFLADEVISRGGALSPEDHAWLAKLMGAHQRTSLVPGDESAEAVPDPWERDTQPQVFESDPASTAADVGGAQRSDEDLVAEARRLRREGAAARHELRSELARLSSERQRLRHVVERLLSFAASRLMPSQVDIDISLQGLGGTNSSAAADQENCGRP